MSHLATIVRFGCICCLPDTDLLLLMFSVEFVCDFLGKYKGYYIVR